MRVWLAIDGDGSAWLFDKLPQMDGGVWTAEGEWFFPFTGLLPYPIAPGECREFELDLMEVVDTKQHAPRLPERAETRTGRTRQ